ncbi:MAG: HIT family protein [Zoogloeaceae bacterium]|nr:HIT family protein [Zoogloeaceae bacterium]
MTECPLCHPADETLLWQDEVCRLIRVGDADYPAYLRVIWKAHKREMSDIEPAAQRHLLHVVLAAEATLRTLLQPHKINLASFGNVVPHLHWHIIARDPQDRHFPEPIWGTPQRDGRPLAVPADRDLTLIFRDLLAEMTAG